jgi:hypothetical protein
VSIPFGVRGHERVGATVVNGTAGEYSIRRQRPRESRRHSRQWYGTYFGRHLRAIFCNC